MLLTLTFHLSNSYSIKPNTISFLLISMEWIQTSQLMHHIDKEQEMQNNQPFEMQNNQPFVLVCDDEQVFGLGHS